MDIPYFRTPEFSGVMFENEMYIKNPMDKTFIIRC